MSKEIEAMGKIEAAVADLEPDEVERVVAWMIAYATGRLGAAVSLPNGGGRTGRESEGMRGERADGEPREFERIGDLMDEANPTSGAHYVLVAAYWLQEVQGNENVTGFQVNNELKNLGNGVSNITEAFDTLKNQRPALARQIAKSGPAKQARKRYRLTEAGIRRVEQMIAGGDSE
jgi:hypothetical protein